MRNEVQGVCAAPHGGSFTVSDAMEKIMAANASQN
jgi:hypothetical protein